MHPLLCLKKKKKNLDLCCDKKILIWFRKIKSIFVHVKKIVFDKEKSDLCLLNKTKSFGLKKKEKKKEHQICFEN